MADQVVLVIGAGGMGEAIARRVGSGAHLLLADFDPGALDAAAARLSGAGQRVTSQIVDVTSRDSVKALAGAAADLGDVTKVVHTAGLSPVQAPVAAILAVDLLGVALVLDEFGAVVARGGAGIVISSMAGRHQPPLAAEDVAALATAPADELLTLPLTDPARFRGNSGSAYVFAKHANYLRVQAASTLWASRGARVNSISPGVIATPMGAQELDGEHGAGMRAMIAGSNAGRVGTPEDIAAAAAFLLGPDSGFISGTDLLVDGGVTASLTAPLTASPA
ncbi:SDR family oxidoreductase [Actinocorallia sp. A-T 12471]|uniref:SDR family oxidoreductase n=1 Tax=Actinocorallia sp. A-T 12471 TaxID=3089813 RepID=UPI0029D024CB|nr:SDR family oxidoreductase [Actinocorallia sp. A-T 12471]MDX6742174.1 SDR family oxidoreductase [Actinocorallia sp. A-T 12471]